MHFRKPSTRHSAVRKAAAKAMNVRSSAFEPLEERRLMSVNFTGGTYQQNFDTVTGTAWTNDSTLPGWSLYRQPATAPVAISSIVQGTGSSNTGSFYSFASTGSADHALGGVGSGGAYFGSPGTGSVAGWMAAAFTNSSGNGISNFTFSYDGEEWRNGGNTSAQTMTVQYGYGATFSTVSTWTNVTSANFTSPTVGATATALDGNAAANRAANLTGNITGTNWAAGQTLWIRWVEVNDSGNDHGLAIDNFSLTAGTPQGAGTLVVDPSSQVVNEAAGTVSFTVDRVGGTQGAVSADILVNDGTAVAGDDFGQPSISSVSFADGDSTGKTFTIPIYDDSKYEIAEQFTVGLTNATGTDGTPTIGAPATVTITDNDSPFYQQSFESPEGNGYTFNGGATGDYQTPVGTSTDYAYFGRFASPDTTAVGRKDFSGGFDGSYAIQGQNTSDDAFADGANPDRTISVGSIDITGKTDLVAFVSLGADVSSGTYQDWTSINGISIYADIDGNSTLIGQFKPSGATGAALLQDTNFDGIGDGASLTMGSLKDFAFPISGTGNSLTINIVANSTAAYQAYAIDNVRVDGTSNATALPSWLAPGSAAAWDAASQTLTVTGATSIIADPGTDNPNIVADGSAAVITINPTSDERIHIAGLTLTNGASASLESIGAARSATNHRLLVVNASQLSIGAGSVLNLHDNDMVVKNSVDASIVGNLIDSGLITSDADNFITALGYGMNDGSAFFSYDHFGPGATQADQEAVGSSDLLVKFTYEGDGNLDGVVNNDDYFYVDFNLGNSTNSTWATGDFNHDGVTNNDDYFFVDFNLNNPAM